MIETMPTIAEDEKLPDTATNIGLPQKNSHKAVRDYQEAIYEDLPPTIVRETVSNAVDAHRMRPEDMPHQTSELGSEFELPVGRGVKVNLSTGKLLGESSQPIFTVTDYGPGMSPEYMRGPVTEYRTTGKGHTNRLLGGKGIGAKCPLGYKDTFLWDVCWEGVMRTYVFQRHQDGDKMFVINKTEYESRPFGTRVRVPVDESDIEDFKEACVDQLAFLAGEIDFIGKLAAVSKPKMQMETDRFGVMEEDYVEYPFDHGYGYYDHKALNAPIVTVGGVPYELNLKKIDGVRRAPGLVLHMGPGEVTLTTSRDAIQYDDKTTENIKSAIEKTVVEELKAHIANEAEDVGDLSPLQTKLLHKSLSRNPDNYDQVPNFVQENYRAIKLLRQVDSFNLSFTKSVGSLGNLKRVERNRWGSTKYKFKTVRDQKAIDKMLSGAIPVYWTLGDTDGPTNRKLTDRHSKYYLWRLSREGSKLHKEAKRRFKSYDAVGVEDQYRTSSVNETGSDRFAAYEWSVSKGKFAKNYETPATAEKADLMIYGHKADREDIARLARYNYYLDGTSFSTVVRVAKSNASALKNAGHMHIGEYDRWDVLQARMIQQYNAYDLAKRTKWFKNFKGADELKPLFELWQQVKNASGRLWRKKPDRKTPSYAPRGSKSLHEVKKSRFPAGVAEKYSVSQKYPDGIGQLARRLEKWEDTAYALKSASDKLSRSRTYEKKEQSIRALLGPKAKRMSEVPSVYDHRPFRTDHSNSN
jgi:hypothetical protein